MMIIFVLVFLSVSSAWAQPVQTKKLAALAKNVDWSCFKPRVLGPCAKPRPGVYVGYWEPTVIETVKGIHSSQPLTGSNIQFSEVHIYDFPLKLVETALGCQLPNTTLGIRYLSEVDAPLWRMQSSIEHNLPQTKAAARTKVHHVGNWGPLYPRMGLIVHPSSAVSSGLSALRGMSIATEVPNGHIVTSPLDFKMNFLIDQMQMVYPQKTMCMAPGIDPRLWEPGRISKDGEYVWLYFHYRQDCCSPVPP